MATHTGSTKNNSTDFLSASSFYRTATIMSPSTLLLGRVREEELKLLYKDPNKYQTNSKGLILFRIISFFILSLIVLVAYNGGFRSVIMSLEEFEDLAVWQKIWNSSIPLWSILISNFGILLICATTVESKRLFIRIPRKPLVLLIIMTMSVSSFVLFLHPLDEVFYPGMALVFLQNYLWVLLMVKPADPLAHLVHPYLHNSLEGNSWLSSFKRKDGTKKETSLLNV